MPEDVVPEDGVLYDSTYMPPVITALSLVPDAKRAYYEMAEQHYLSTGYVGRPDLDIDIRALNRMQLEIVATRTSSLHQCLY